MLEARIESVLNGESEHADFPPFQAKSLGKSVLEILARKGTVTVHSSKNDPYGSAFVYENETGDFDQSVVPKDGFLRVSKIPFRSFPGKPGDSTEVQEKARHGQLPFVYTPLKNMAVAAHEEGAWTKPQIIPVGTMELDPLADRYGQTIFGGNKVYKLDDGRVVMFRPDVHANRFWRNADRMMMPTMTPKELIKIDEELVRANWDFIPDPGTAQVYLAPGLRAAQNLLGVERNPRFLFTCVASPVGPIFAKEPLKLWVDRDFHRAAKGGVGDTKAGGNYAQVLRITAEVKDRGFDDSLFIDNENKWVREQRASNSFFVTKDKWLVTPPLSPEILDGVTRDSILAVGKELAAEGKLKGVRDDKDIPVSELRLMQEAFACGTGVTLAPVGSITDRKDRFEMDVSEGGIGPVTRLVQERLGLVMQGKHQKGRYKAWLHEVKR
ncbi:MAG: aminotransferase class IV [Patescibacteria group bacterium]